MKSLSWRTVLVLLLYAAGNAVAAQPLPPILDPKLLPPLANDGRTLYVNRFVIGNLPRAFAVAANGAFGGQWGGGTLESVRAAALKSCADKGGAGCAVYAENLDVVWPGHASKTSPPPGPLISGPGYEFVPDPRFIWYGPQAARGLYVWSHGTGQTDARGLQPQAHVRAFNNAGFDVVRFDRALNADAVTKASEWLHDGLAELRRRGWKMVVAGGQSRGGWNSLQTLDTPGLADVVIAISPAARGEYGGGLSLGGAELWSIAHAAASPRARVAFVQFRDDPFAGDLDNRITTINAQLRPRVGALLVIDRPDGYSGHYGGGSPKFAEQFAACLYRFATDPAPPSGC